MALTYVCEDCGGRFESDWTDDEAMAECYLLFGPIPEEDQMVLCDDCFKKLPHPSDTVDGVRVNQ